MRVVVYTVDATWDSSSVAAISIGDEDLTIPYLGGSSTTVTISNLANIAVSGKLTMIGVGDGVLDIRWNNSLGEVTDASRSNRVHQKFLLSGSMH